MLQFPNIPAVVKRLWHDPVWSKVIAAGIIAGAGAVFWLAPVPHNATSPAQPSKTVKENLRKGAATLLADAQRLYVTGQNDQARADFNNARTLYRQVGDKPGEANVLTQLGDLESRLGRYDQARADFNDARTLYQQVGNRGLSALKEPWAAMSPVIEPRRTRGPNTC